MAVKIISGQKITPQADESLGGTILRNVTAGGARALESAAGLPGNILNLAQSGLEYIKGEPLSSPQIPLPTSNQIRENVTNPLAEQFLPKDYLEPKGRTEEIGQMIAGDLPAILGGGLAGILPSLARSGVSNVGIKTAQDLGLGPVGQAITGVLSGAGIDFVRKGRLSNIKKIAEDTRKTEYKKAEDIAKNLNFPARNLKDSLFEISQEASKKLKTTSNKDVVKFLDTIDKDINFGKANVEKIWSRKKELNEILRDPKLPSSARSFYEKSVKSMNDFLQEAGAQHPEFGKPFNVAEDLTRGLKSKSFIREIIEENTDLKKMMNNPTAKLAVLGSTAYMTGLPGAAASLGGTYGLRHATRLYDFYANSPEARKLFGEATKGILTDDKALLANSLTKIGREAIAREEQPKNKVKIISGHKLS